MTKEMTIDEALDAILALAMVYVESEDFTEESSIIIMNAINKIVDELEKQPRWIPCSKKMPKVSDHYLIQYSRHICPDEMAVAFYSVEEAEVDGNYTWEFKPYADCKEVIAWMPLPQHYKAESERRKNGRADEHL
jgi:hypothetical protein